MAWENKKAKNAFLFTCKGTVILESLSNSYFTTVAHFKSGLFHVCFTFHDRLVNLKKRSTKSARSWREKTVKQQSPSDRPTVNYSRNHSSCLKLLTRRYSTVGIMQADGNIQRLLILRETSVQ